MSETVYNTGTTMSIYQGVVLVCRNCFEVCRFERALQSRRACENCGLSVKNWDEIMESVALLENKVHEDGKRPDWSHPAV